MSDKHFIELMKRGVGFQDACMLVEAIYSCAIEGVKQPSTKADYDRLAEGVLGRKEGKKHAKY